MKRNVNVFIPLGLGAFLLLILFSPGFCAAGDKAPELPGPILSLPGNLADLPMEISFNGKRLQKEGLTAERTAQHPVSEGQGSMLNYITITAPISSREIFDSHSTGVTGNASEKISFEIQAGLLDLSGALFIVFQL